MGVYSLEEMVEDIQKEFLNNTHINRGNHHNYQYNYSDSEGEPEDRDSNDSLDATL